MQRTGIIVAAALVIGAVALAVAGAGAQGAEYDRLYQVSTIDALLQGVYDGTVTIAGLEREGDTGIGTFDRLDGELTMLGGETWQARSDGSVTRAPPNETTPFAAVARFRADRTGTLGAAADLNATGERLDAFLSSTNLFALVRADGRFDYVRARAAPAQSEPYVPLADAIAQQAVFEWQNVTGTLVAMYTPPYVEGIGVTGWHLHFVSDDRTFGGHVLEIASDGTAQVGVDDLSSFTVVLPVGTAFTETDLTRNMSSDLEVVEKGQ